ncbi:NUDIX domain-containing protein [Nocardioides speluncae]|uniref:NUDIX domain-containing protein n=1 Tax=Nocardioides speluncae TaxID=2670337 RepID=UPI000D68B22A|nr:NUDIX hydrolase [Nocardioides speluncae]
MRRFASVILVDPKGRVLLQERDEHPLIDPERWGFVGGSVEPGEADEAAAYRELAEETGVHLDGGLELYGEFTVHHVETRSDDQVQVWTAATSLDDADIVVGEGRQIVFVEPATVSSLSLTAAARAVLIDYLDSSMYRRLSGAGA